LLLSYFEYKTEREITERVVEDVFCDFHPVITNSAVTVDRKIQLDSMAPKNLRVYIPII